MKEAARDKTGRRVSKATDLATGEDDRKPAKKKSRGEVFIVRDRCKGCAFCVEFCPTQVLKLDDAFNAKGYHPPVVVDVEACNGCDLCGLYCPDFAIHGVRRRVKESES